MTTATTKRPRQLERITYRGKRAEALVEMVTKERGVALLITFWKINDQEPCFSVRIYHVYKDHTGKYSMAEDDWRGKRYEDAERRLQKTVAFRELDPFHGFTNKGHVWSHAANVTHMMQTNCGFDVWHDPITEERAQREYTLEGIAKYAHADPETVQEWRDFWLKTQTERLEILERVGEKPENTLPLLKFRDGSYQGHARTSSYQASKLLQEVIQKHVDENAKPAFFDMLKKWEVDIPNHANEYN